MMATLSDRMDFDHVIWVRKDGTVADAPPGIYAPELHDGELEADGPWSLLSGYTGQYGYRGPIMHSSEYIGGGLERDILANPGYYVCLVNYSTDDDEPDGWAIAYRGCET